MQRCSAAVPLFDKQAEHCLRISPHVGKRPTEMWGGFEDTSGGTEDLRLDLAIKESSIHSGPLCTKQTRVGGPCYLTGKLCSTLVSTPLCSSCIIASLSWIQNNNMILISVAQWHDSSSALTSAGKDHKGKYSVPTLDVTSQQLVLDANQTLRLSCRWVSGRSILGSHNHSQWHLEVMHYGAKKAIKAHVFIFGLTSIY